MLVGQSCIAQTYTAPVQYQQTYAQSYVEKTVFVAVEAPDYYAGLVGAAQRSADRQAQVQQAAATTDQKIDRLAALVEQLQRRLETPPDAQPPLPEKPGQPPPQSEAVPPPPTVSRASLPARPSGAVAVLTQHCAKCHTGSGSQGGFTLFDRPGQLARLDPDSLQSIRAAVLSGSMPKGRGPLTLREFAAINDYVSGQTGPVALNTIPRRKTR
jgi:hypothetical protein